MYGHKTHTESMKASNMASLYKLCQMGKRWPDEVMKPREPLLIPFNYPTDAHLQADLYFRSNTSHRSNAVFRTFHIQRRQQASHGQTD